MFFNLSEKTSDATFTVSLISPFQMYIMNFFFHIFNHFLNGCTKLLAIPYKRELNYKNKPQWFYQFKPSDQKDPLLDSPLGLLLKSITSCCFIGDSITAGSENGGYGWYRYISAILPHLKTSTISQGGATSKIILNERNKDFHSYNLQKTELFIQALGTNDIRYRDHRGALTIPEYLHNLNEIIQQLIFFSPEAKFLFISPWYSQKNDPACPLIYEEKLTLYREYNKALRDWIQNNRYLYIDTTTLLFPFLEKNSYYSTYFIDYIHPNKKEGVKLYSQAVLKASKLKNCSNLV